MESLNPKKSSQFQSERHCGLDHYKTSRNIKQYINTLETVLIFVYSPFFMTFQT